MANPLPVTTYTVRSKLWTVPPISIAILSDLHVCARWMPLSRITEIIAQTHALAPDLILLPGDFLVRKLVGARPIASAQIADTLAALSAPFGVYASLGNHDWQDCPAARANGFSATSVEPALEAAGIPVLSNRSLQLANGAYLAGLDSLIGPGETFDPDPRHDADAAFKDIPEGASTILMAHEPDFFFDEVRPAALQVSGHTHAGQIGTLGMWLSRPSRYGTRLAYGLHQDGARHVVISAGIGYSTIPFRVSTPSEIVLVQLEPADADGSRA